MQQDFRHLSMPEAALATAVAEPRRVALGGLAGIVAMGWIYLVVMAAAAGVTGTFSALGPGMDVFDRIAAWAGLDAIVFPMVSSGLLATLAAICQADPAAWGPGEAGLNFGMWMAMALAMMLPTAAPMVRTYAEIADTAAAKGGRIVSPYVLAAGYLTVWAAFATGATGLHWLLGSAGLVSGNGAPLAIGLAAAVIAIAGAYQFLPLKAACLVKCANPFPFLFANWTERRAGVFRLGLSQGLYCLGCCWAMMLLMFAVGIMNLLWIALLTVLVMAEKMIGRAWFSRALGMVFIVWSAGLTAKVSGLQDLWLW